MKSMEILKLEHGYTAIVDDQFFAYGLTPDEVLGVLASSLFGNGRPLFLRTYEELALWNEHALRKPKFIPFALIEK